MNKKKDFSRRILSELDNILAENRQAQIKHLILSHDLFTPVKAKKIEETDTIFYTAKTTLTRTEYFTPRSS